MTQKQADDIFDSSLGRQLEQIYTTSDNKAFIRRTEAELHTEGKLDKNTKPLKDKEIEVWFPQR